MCIAATSLPLGTFGKGLRRQARSVSQSSLISKTTAEASVPLLDEVHDVLFRKKFAAQLAEQGVDAADLFEGYAALVQLVVPAGIGPVILADPDDDIVLATAVAGDAGAIVSGDAHLLGIGEFQGISIVTPSAAVSRLAV
jgi:putative PIN family toxin of toxin-antitoxin system